MEYIIEKIIRKISAINSEHADKLKKNLAAYTRTLYPESESFFKRYEDYLIKQGLSIDFAVDCYLKMYRNMLEERWKFLKRNNYSNTSFAEVEKAVYSNPDVMTAHMNGLTLAQFLWFEQYERFLFFKNNLLKYTTDVTSYIEIGGGHGLYLWEATNLLNASCTFEMIDISESSLALAKGIIDKPNIKYKKQSLFDIEDNVSVDFFTMGEMLEHLENPKDALQKLRLLIRNGGKGFISTPINSPMIDHIYLFNNVEEIRDLFNQSGLKILEEKIVISEPVSVETALRKKIPVMYAAFVEGA